MTDTANKGYALPTVGADFGTWGTKLNSDLALIDLNLGGSQAISVASGNVVASSAQASYLYTSLTGTITGNRTYTLPAVGGLYVISNDTSGSYTVTIACAGGGSSVVIPQGSVWTVVTDGTNAKGAFSGTGSFSTLTVSGAASIGTTLSIGGNLTVSGGSLAINKTSGNSYLELASYGGSGRIWRAVSYSDGTFAVSDSTAALNRFVIDSSGNYYFGGLPGVAIISYYGRISAASGYQCRTGTAGGFEPNVFNLSWNGADVGVYIDAVGIGNINFTSDPRIKQNITDAQAGALDRVLSWRVIEYEYRDIDIWQQDGVRRLGFDASQIRTITPQAVSGEPDALTPEGKIKPLLLEPIPLIAELAAAVQELTRKVAALEARP